MGRKPNTPTPLNAGRTLLLQQRFLQTINRVCPEVVEGLKKVFGKSTHFDEWAEKFGIRQGWVEKAAKSTLAAWVDNPALMNESVWVPPVVSREYQYGHPDFLRTRPMMAGFHVTSYLFSPATQKLLFHAALDDDLKDIDTWAASEELTVRRLIPGDLDKKLECAALYLYRRLTLNEICNLDGYRTTPPNMSLWILKTLRLLNLPKRGPR